MPWFLQPVYLWHTPFSPAPPPPGGRPLPFLSIRGNCGYNQCGRLESRFALPANPKGTCKEEIHRLFTAKHINPRTFLIVLTWIQRCIIGSKTKPNSPNFQQSSLCAWAFLWDTLTGYHLIALAGYTLLPRNTLHRIYAYFIENSQSLTISECNKFLEDMGFHKQGELLGSNSGNKATKNFLTY